VSGSGATVRVGGLEAEVPADKLRDSELCVPILHEQQPCEPPTVGEAGLEAAFDTDAGGSVLLVGDQVKLKDREGYFFVQHMQNDMLTVRKCWAVGEAEFDKTWVLPVGSHLV
jgi:hypothetical protein